MAETTQFLNDGDGNLVKKINPDNSRTIYAGGLYEVNKNAGGTVTGTTTYYPAGGAMRVNGTLYYMLKDHLGSASVVIDSTGNIVGEQRYYPFGETRLATGTLYTDKLFTGQRNIAGLGIYHYQSRFYSPYLNHFTQPDTLVSDPYNPQAWNRYAYALNNPIRYNDPSGHVPSCGPERRCSRPIGDKRDLTKWLVAAAVDIAESSDMDAVRVAKAAGQGGLAWALFISVVKDGAKYDVKDKIEIELGKTTKIGNSWYEFSTAGNILYGFYGKAAGFTEFELRAGAGAAQLADYNRDKKSGKGDPSTFYDTEDDYAAVGFGMYLYDNYYEDDNNLTQADLLDAFETYEYSNQLALKDKPKVFQPRYYEYPVNRFYQME